jgi:PPIC-type PPIASE domain
MRARLLHEPLFAFLVAGLALFLLYSWLRQPDAVVLDKGTRDALLAEFETLTGRKPAPSDIERIEREYVADELLFRAALDAGLHLQDTTVRRALIEEMRQRATGVLPDATVDDLLDYYSDHLERYHSEPTASFEHVYFVEAPVDAGAVLAQLNRGSTIAGDAFRYGRTFEHYGRSMLRGMFGEPFVAAVWAAAPRQWIGPLESPHGWHFVRVSGRQTATLRPFAEVSNQVENDWIASQIQAAVDRKVAELRRDQRITIER